MKSPLTWAFARQLGHDYAVELLLQTPEDEKACDHRLTQIAEGSVNPHQLEKLSNRTQP